MPNDAKTHETRYWLCRDNLARLMGDQFADTLSIHPAYGAAERNGAAPFYPATGGRRRRSRSCLIDSGD